MLEKEKKSLADEAQIMFSTEKEESPLTGENPTTGEVFDLPPFNPNPNSVFKGMFSSAIVASLAHLGIILDNDQYLSAKASFETLFDKLPVFLKQGYVIIAVSLALPPVVKYLVTMIKQKYGFGEPEHPLQVVDRLKESLSNYLGVQN
jgi:hypothetical protein